MTALELLAAQHTEVMHLFDKLERHPEPNAKSSIFEQIADDLAVQMSLEEKLIYPAACGKNEQRLLRRALDEHFSIKCLLVELMEPSREKPKFDATLDTLKKKVKAHIEREERELFPKARRHLEAFGLEDLGLEMQDSFLLEMKHSPGRRLVDRLERASDRP